MFIAIYIISTNSFTNGCCKAKKRIIFLFSWKIQTMEHINTYEIHPKENFYFTIKIVVSAIVYTLMGYFLFFADLPLVGFTKYIFFFYAAIIALILLFQFGILIGYIKGNAVKISENQFSDIYATVVKQSTALGLTHVPDVYLLQAGGLLNAFATRFVGRNYIVLYSDVLEEAYEDNKAAVDFIIGHELGHIKRNHLTKNLLLFPSVIIPFLNAAYSRACEYTCDSIGACLSPQGAQNGLLLLAAGKRLYKKVNLDTYVAQTYMEGGFWKWFAEKVSTHPNLTKRLEKFNYTSFQQTAKPVSIVDEIKHETPATETDHSKYFPS
jgi:Zn-dependent protease with chaperone function